MRKIRIHGIIVTLTRIRFDTTFLKYTHQCNPKAYLMVPVLTRIAFESADWIARVPTPRPGVLVFVVAV